MADYNYIGFEGKPKLKIRRWLGTGTTLLKPEIISGKNCCDNVMYLFFSLLFLPIVPLGCYCFSLSRNGNPCFINAKWRWKELMIIYIECWLLFPIFFLSIIVWIILLCYLLIHFLIPEAILDIFFLLEYLE